MVTNLCKFCLIWLLLLHFSGCAFINVSLTPSVTPLKEYVIEGEGRPKILLVDVSGIISEKKRSSGFGLREKPSPVIRIKEALQKAEEDEDIVGLIVKINSPGGTVTATDIIYHEIVSFKKRKGIPVYACIMGIGASGGFYVAAGADEVIAHPTAIMGSIGVIALKFNIAGLLTKIGVEEETFKSGDKKDIFSPFRPNTPEEREIVQTIINKLHERFVDAVYAERKKSLTRQELEGLADGRIFTADQALEAKLIDRIGYLDDVTRSMKESLDIEEARIITYYRPGEYKGTIYSEYPANNVPLMNLVNYYSGDFAPFPGVEFMYLWMP